jgi:hypothetical protein
LNTIPTCPRCGYDQSGAISAWGRCEPARCPLDGVCSECGLEFRWADVMRLPERQVQGLFEHAVGRRQCASWALRTWLMTAWPAVFWKRVTILAPVHPARLLIWPLVVWAMVWAAGSLLHNLAYGVRLAGAWAAGTASRADWLPLLEGWTSPCAQPRRYWPTRGLGWRPSAELWIGNFAGPVAMTAAWPLLLLVLRRTMSTARVRTAHIVRATAYSLAWVPALALLHIADGALSTWRPAVKSGLGPYPGLGAASSLVLHDHWPAAVLAITLWLGLWWHEAICRGFRLRHGTEVWAFLLIAALLMEVVVVFLTDRGRWLVAWYLT